MSWYFYLESDYKSSRCLMFNQMFKLGDAFVDALFSIIILLNIK